MSAAANASPRAANQRGAARLAAVQALYQMDMGGTTAEVLEQFDSGRLGADDGLAYRTADPLFFRDLVEGVVREQRRLDPAIDEALASGWPLTRIDRTLRAILRSGAYELACRPDVPVPVVVTEYLDVTRAFHEDDVVPMVNAVLDQLGRVLRADASAARTP